MDTIKPYLRVSDTDPRDHDPRSFVMAIEQDLINVKLNCHTHALLFDNPSCKCNRNKREKFVHVHGVWLGTSLQTQNS